jgi:hypothetical protein
MKRYLLFSLSILIFIPGSFCQIEPEFREDFLYAESEFLFEEYAEALDYYENLNTQYPDNDNINYKIGVCLLNDPFRKQEAIGYLEKAVQNINPKYRENNFRETAAPLEAYFYLGNAYRINLQLEKAIETYQLFREQADPELYDLELVDEQIQACRNAMELMKRPVDIDIQNMGEFINGRYPETNFVISGDESAIVYVQKLPFYDAPLFMEKIDGEWSFERNLIPSEDLGPGVDDDIYPVALSYEGDEMIIYRSDDFIGDLYSSRFVEGIWTPIEKLNENINTKYWESHASLTKSGDTLYFTSNRKGTFGGLDIYYSVRGDDGEWGIPVNLGPTINTKYNEETPVISSDGKTLYFSSYGHYNMGGYDVFYSTRLENGEWSVPLNAGYPINTTDDDVFFMPVRNGTFAYYPRYLEDSYGQTDIYQMEIYSETHPRKFQINGILNITDLESLTRPLRIAIIERSGRDTVAITYADAETGEFVFEVTRGRYDLLIEGEDIETTTSAFVVPEGYVQKELDLKQSIPLTQALKQEDLIPEIVDHIGVEDTLIQVSTDEPIEINLSLENKARLFVDTYHENLQTGSDSFLIEEMEFTYSYTPVPGINLLKIKMIDTIDRLSFKDIHVIYTPQAMKQPIAEVQEAAVVDQEPSTMEESTLQLQSDLADISTGVLKGLLDNLDLNSEGISTQEELLIYLREHADEYNYDTQDVHDLILKKMQVDYLQDYLDELIRITDDDSLRSALLKIDLIAGDINSLQELYESILFEADVYGYEGKKVNETFSLLSQREELSDLIGTLSSQAGGDLKNVIEELDISAEDIRNPLEFISYLLEQAGNYDYTEQDVMALLLKTLEENDLRETVKILIATSSGDLQTLLINLDLAQNNIHSLSDLYDYLVMQSRFYDFTEEDVMKLFLNLLQVFKDQPLIKEIEIPSEPEERERTGGTWQFYVLGGILLIIILFFIGRRRKSDKDQKE